MRRISIIATWVLAALCGFALCASAAKQEGRVLFIVETSSAMNANKAAVNSSMQGIIDSGLEGQLQYGDTLGIWTYNDKVDTACPMIMWRGEHVQDIKGAVNAWMSRQKYTHKAQFSKVLPLLQTVVRSSQKMIVIWISNGDDPISGTPFDKAINELQKEFRADFHKQRIPFVTALVVRNGAVVDFTVNPGDASLRLPDFLKKEAQELAAAQKSEAEAAAAEAAVVKTNKPPLIIRVGPSPELLQQKQTNVVNEAPVATNAPAVAVSNASVTNVVPPVAAQVSQTNSNVPVAAAAAATNVVAQTNKTVEKPVTNAVAVAQTNIAPTPAAVVPSNVTAVVAPSAVPVTSAAPAIVTKAPPTAEVVKSAVAPAPAINKSTAAEQNNAKPVATMNLLSGPSPTMTYIVAGVVVLALIVAAVGFMVMRSSETKGPSFISQSMTRERLNSDGTTPSSDNPADLG